MEDAFICAKCRENVNGYIDGSKLRCGYYIHDECVEDLGQNGRLRTCFCGRHHYLKTMNDNIRYTTVIIPVENS